MEEKEKKFAMVLMLVILAAAIIPTAVFGGIAGTIGYHDGYTVKTFFDKPEVKQPDTSAMREGDIILKKYFCHSDTLLNNYKKKNL
jgi:hypothetical protein